MPQIIKVEYITRALNFIDEHQDSYTPRELAYIRRNLSWGLNKAYIPDILRQIYNEAEIIDTDKNMYLGFIDLLQKNFDINTNIIEVGGGIIPSLAKHIALRQKTGTITVYDPRLITDINCPDNLMLKKEMFGKETPLENATMIIGFMPCDATNLLIDVACKNNLDFMIALCEGGMRPGYEWLETDDEWISHVESNARIGIEENNMGRLGIGTLEQYDNPYPVIYNKRKKT